MPGRDERGKRLALRLAAALLLAVFAAEAQARWQIDVVDGPHVEPGDLALRTDGEPVAAWGGSAIEVATRTAGSWALETVTSEPGSYWWVSLELDAADRPVLSYHDHREGSLKLARFDGSGWTHELVDADGAVGEWSSLAIADTGELLVAYRDIGNRSLKLARNGGGGWSVETVAATGDTGTWCSMALDSAGNPWIAHRDEAAGSIELSRHDGSDWIHETVDPGVQPAGGHVRLALVDDQPVVSYQRLNENSLVVARWLGFWVREVVGTERPGGHALAAGLSGRIQLAVPFDGYWTHDGAAWSRSAATELLGFRLGALAIDASDRPWILGFDARREPGFNASRPGTVSVTWRDAAGTWTSEILRAGEPFQWGRGVSLSVDALGRPAIAYGQSSVSQAGADVSLHVAEKLGADWTREQPAPGVHLLHHSVAHAPDGRLALFHQQAAPVRGAFYRQREGGSWTSDQIDTNFLCCHTGLVFDSDDQAHAARGVFDAAWIERGGPGAWSRELVETPTRDPENLSMARLADGRPAIVFSRRPTVVWTYAERMADGSWPTTDVSLDPCVRPSLAMAPDGRRWSACTELVDAFTAVFRVAWSDGAGWTVEQLAVGSSDSGATSLSIGADGQPVAAFEDRLGIALYSRAADGSWSRSRFHEGAIGHPSALRHDAAGGLVLAYHQGGTVRVAFQSAAGATSLLHRGVVSALTPGWRAAALPLTPGNDDETPPFPAEAAAGSSTLDAASPSAPLVLYRVLGSSGAPIPGAPLRVSKEAGGIRLSY